MKAHSRSREFASSQNRRDVRRRQPRSELTGKPHIGCAARQPRPRPRPAPTSPLPLPSPPRAKVAQVKSIRWVGLELRYLNIIIASFLQIIFSHLCNVCAPQATSGHFGPREFGRLTRSRMAELVNRLLEKVAGYKIEAKARARWTGWLQLATAGLGLELRMCACVASRLLICSRSYKPVGRIGRASVSTCCSDGPNASRL